MHLWHWFLYRVVRNPTPNGNSWEVYSYRISAKMLGYWMFNTFVRLLCSTRLHYSVCLNRKWCFLSPLHLFSIESIIHCFICSHHLNFMWFLNIQGARYAASRMGNAKALSSRTFRPAGRYYPCALPKEPNCIVKFNFGPDFEFFPQRFRWTPNPSTNERGASSGSCGWRQKMLQLKNLAKAVSMLF